jgi:hypothetical protein
MTTPTRPHSRYLAMLLVQPLLVLVLTYAFAGTELFRKQCRGKWVGRGDAAFEARGLRCELLIFGDSTAITGLDPELIEAKTGLRTCNIAQTLGVLSVLQMEPLDRFLANNEAPRYLLLQMASDDLAALPEWSGSYVEGVFPLVTFFSADVVASRLLSHPDAVFTLAQSVVSLTTRRVLGRNPPEALDAPRLDRANVFLTLPLAARAGCDDLDARRRDTAPSSDFVQALRRRYQKSAEHLLIHVAPTADCDSRYEAKRRALSGLTDNTYERFPIAEFNEGFVHFTKRGSAHLSEQLAAQLLARPELEQALKPGPQLPATLAASKDTEP